MQNQQLLAGRLMAGRFMTGGLALLAVTLAATLTGCGELEKAKATAPAPGQTQTKKVNALQPEKGVPPQGIAKAKMAAKPAPVASTQECGQLSGEAMRVEAEASSLKMTLQMNVKEFIDSDLQQLKSSLAALKTLKLKSKPVDALRDRYVTQMNSAIAPVEKWAKTKDKLIHQPITQAFAHKTDALANFRKDQIFFAECKAK